MRLPDMLRFGRKAAAPATDGYGVFVDMLRGLVSSKSGASVTRQTAMEVAAVFGCLRVLMDGVSQVPMKLMRTSKSSVSRHPQRTEASEHPLYDVLHRQPNDWQTSFEFRETMMLHAALTGNGYAFKSRSQVMGKQYIELLPLAPNRCRPVQAEDWSIVYELTGKDGSKRTVPRADIWHLRGPSWDGVAGLDVLQLARHAVGLAITTEETHSKLHGKGVRPSGVYSIEGSLNPEQYDKLKKWVAAEFAGAENAGVPMILDRSAKWMSTAMSGVDSQHIETRRHQIEEICRFFRVLPIMIGYSGASTPTYASAEQMFLAHVVHTLMPWYERIQQSADVNLLTRTERVDGGLYVQLFEAGLLRGAMKDTAEYLYRLTQAGVMERNEARGKLELNPLPGLDDPLTPTNLTTDPTGAPAGQGANP